MVRQLISQRLRLCSVHTSSPPRPPRRPGGLAIGRARGGLALLVVLLDERGGETPAVEDGRHDHGPAGLPVVVLVADPHDEVGVREDVLVLADPQDEVVEGEHALLEEERRERLLARLGAVEAAAEGHGHVGHEPENG